VNKRIAARNAIADLQPSQIYTPVKTNILQPALSFFNGKGGFSSDGKEYIIITSAEQQTPAPWVNIIANAGFGTVVSESGAAYTWAENAHEYRLTPWNNDAVSDISGEAFYLRDEKTGHYWSPMPYPVKTTQPYITRHGFGYSVFEHTEDAVSTETTVFTDLEAPVKFISIKNKKSFRQAEKTFCYRLCRISAYRFTH